MVNYPKADHPPSNTPPPTLYLLINPLTYPRTHSLINTHPPYQLTHSINPPINPLTHPINPPYQPTLSTHSPTLSTHPINPPYQLTHPINSLTHPLDQPTLSTPRCLARTASHPQKSSPVPSRTTMCWTIETIENSKKSLLR